MNSQPSRRVALTGLFVAAATAGMIGASLLAEVRVGALAIRIACAAPATDPAEIVSPRT